MKAEQFLGWFRRLGGNLPDNFEEVLNTRYVYDPDPISSFKNRAAEIKKKFNHKFRAKSIHDDFLKSEPNIETIYFEKK